MSGIVVVGTGMLSPLGATPAEHVFFARAGVGPAAPGGFVDEKGDTVLVAYCPWLGATTAMGSRLSALGEAALRGALSSWPGAAPSLFVCTAAPRLGLDEDDRRQCEASLAEATRTSGVSRGTGEAGFFEALAAASEALRTGRVRAAAIVAVDSFVATAALSAFQRSATSPWDANLPRPAEGAAAVVLTTSDEAARLGLSTIVTVRGSEHRRGEASDDNDAIVDGAAMTAILGKLTGGEAIASSFGQHGVGALRHAEWSMAVARTARAFRSECPFVSVEHEIGSLGAAAGAMNFAFGAAVHHHDAWPEARPEPGPFVAWAISRDGTRGASVAIAGEVR